MPRLSHKSYDDPPDLHSFPTRRSSDLYDPPPMTYSNAAHACEVELDAETGALKILRYVVAEDCGTVLNPFVDRKSTRLNSSHSQISSAVFCLKKKHTLQTESLHPQ